MASSRFWRLQQLSFIKAMYACSQHSCTQQTWLKEVTSARRWALFNLAENLHQNNVTLFQIIITFMLMETCNHDSRERKNTITNHCSAQPDSCCSNHGDAVKEKTLSAASARSSISPLIQVTFIMPHFGT